MRLTLRKKGSNNFFLCINLPFDKLELFLYLFEANKHQNFFFLGIIQLDILFSINAKQYLMKN